MVGSSGLEPPTSRLSGARSSLLSYEPLTVFLPLSHFGGDEEIRTLDPLLAGQVLSQLSYTPIPPRVSCIRVYTLKIEQPKITYCALYSRFYQYLVIRYSLYLSSLRRDTSVSVFVLHRKEVIQPHLPIRLPCYDLTPIIEPTFDSCLLTVSSLASGIPDFHGLTGGVYKARERIHRSMLTCDY